MKDYEKLKNLISDFLSALDTEMELGDYHMDVSFSDEDKIEEYQEAVNEVVSLRQKIEEIIR